MITLNGKIIPIVERFKYLGSIIQKDKKKDEYVNYKIKVGWFKRMSATNVLCDCNIPLSLKEKFYRTIVRLALLYGMEYWTNKKQHI